MQRLDQLRIGDDAAPDHDPVDGRIDGQDMLQCRRGVDIAVVAERDAQPLCSEICVRSRRQFVKILLQACVDDQFIDRIFFIHAQNSFPLRLIADADARFYRYFQRTGRKDLI